MTDINLEDVATIARQRKAAIEDDGENDPSLDSKMDTELESWDDEPYSAGAQSTPKKGNKDVELKKLEDDDEGEDVEEELDWTEEDFTDDINVTGEDSDKKEESTTQGAATDDKKPEANAEGPRPLDEKAVARAINMGLKPDEIQEYAKMGDLNTILDNVEQQRASETPQEADEESTLDFKLELDPDYFDEEFTESLNQQIQEKVGGQFKALQDKIKKLEAERQRERIEAYEREFDAAIGSLDDSLEPILGKEPGRKLDPNSEQMKNREKVIQEVTNLVQSPDYQGQSLSELVSTAVARVFPEQVKQVATRSIQQSLTKRANNLINRPSSRQIQEPPRKRAISAVAEKMAEYGWNQMGEDDL